MTANDFHYIYLQPVIAADFSAINFDEETPEFTKSFLHSFSRFYQTYSEFDTCNVESYWSEYPEMRLYSFLNNPNDNYCRLQSYYRSFFQGVLKVNI